MKIKDINYIFLSIWIVITLILILTIVNFDKKISLFKQTYLKIEELKSSTQDLLLQNHDINLDIINTKLDIFYKSNDIFTKNKIYLEKFLKQNIDENLDLTLLSNDFKKLELAILNLKKSLQNQKKFSINKEFLAIQRSNLFTIKSSVFSSILNLDKIIYNKYTSTYEKLTNNIYIYIVGYLILSLFIFLTITFKVTLPHQRLLKFIKNYTTQNNESILVKGSDEISIFINEFNKLLSNMAKNKDDLLEVNNKKIKQKTIYESIINTIDEDIILYDGNGKEILTNLKPSNDFTKDLQNTIDVLDLFKNQNISKINDWFIINNEKKYLEIDAYSFDDDKLDIYDYVIVSVKDRTSTVLLETQNKKNEQLLVQQSKMASMGEMIGAIAHQWRQPLAIVSGVLTNVEDAYEHNSLNKIYLNKQINVAEKNLLFMSKTIDDFRNFFTPSKKKSKFKVSKAIFNSLHIIQAQLQENLIEVFFNKNLLVLPFKSLYNNSDDFVFGYENEFTQVIVNIITNAKDEFMIKDVKYPKIFIDIHNNNNEIIIDISDNAKGIDPSILDKVFEPYFSTKKELNGTGIGLYMSKMIIEKSMEGSIEVSNANDGAQFRIKLERVDNDR